MDPTIVAILDFVTANRKSLASYIRQKIIQADAKNYVSKLGKDGIEALENEAAGILLDLGCALSKRLLSGTSITSEEILSQLPEEQRKRIRLPRSEEYYSVLEGAMKSGLLPPNLLG